ncbi:amidohydrolase [Pirellula sp. SH-Sr6A]|uniref:amidohydrolase n=1 Tax=Pirellula sp. SH-Sr6A TaxID=1632865 RepID=UPI00143AC9B4|nr:amidohydrolase [Pirellula sp. SH-Sr6A]
MNLRLTPPPRNPFRDASTLVCLLFLLFSWVLANDASSQSPPNPHPADLLIRSGRVLQWSGADAEAVAVRGGKVVWVGLDRDSAGWIDQTTTIVEAHGGLVTPGLNDAHVHFLSGSLGLQQIDLNDAQHASTILERVEAFAKRYPERPVIVGRGWLYGAFAGGLPTRDMLDAVVADKPVLLRCYDGHTIWVNTVALRQAGITRDSPDPPRGLIVRDSTTGEPTGVLKESAQRLVDSLFPVPSLDEKKEALLQGIALAHRVGVTSIQECGVDDAELMVFDTMIQEGRFPLRTHFALSGQVGMNDTDFDRLMATRRAKESIGVRSVKLFIDGVIESHTAYLLSPYANQSTLGLPACDATELQRLIARLDREEWNVMVHAIGEGGVRMTLDAFEHAMQSNPDRKRLRRHRLEHVETIDPSDITRLKPLGVIASMQPRHAEPNSNIFDVWVANIGPSRAERAWAWKSILASGGRLAFGTDWPVVPLDPRPGLQIAVTRQTLDGKPDEPFVRSQQLKLEEALYAYTYGAAFAEGQETEKGAIAPGQMADLVIWKKDLRTLPASELYRAEVEATLFNGQVVYRAGQ